MFKFMKSKKGFTLVELMIVVVIMAILVAVAVPIFSAVTKNARIKTCAANRREIISQLNNYSMGSVDGVQHTAAKNEQFTITTNKDGNAVLSLDTTAVDYITATKFKELFQKVPCCPVNSTKADNSDGGVITVKVKTVTEVSGVDQTASFEVTCTGGTGADKDAHV